MSNALPNDHVARDVFVGREGELATLHATLEETLVGHGRTIVLLGEPGIGKTRLATELASYAQVRGMRILVGRCPDSDGAPPYWPWVQIARAYISECEIQQLRTEMGSGATDLAQVIPAVHERLPDLPSQLRLEPAQERFRFFDSFTTFLKNAAKHQPLLVLLDDLQWADTPSLLFLQFLVRELTDTTLCLVITCREGEVAQQPVLTETLAAIVRATGSQTLRLHGLTNDDVAKFIESTAGEALPPAVRAAVFQRTEGHPFFMTEVVRLLATQQVAIPHESSHPSLFALPPTVRSVIEQRLQSVSAECCRLLTVAAVIGREFHLPVLEAVANPQERQFGNSGSLLKEKHGKKRESNLALLVLLDEALTARLLIPAPQNLGRYSFTHALVQETLYEGMTTTERLSLHRRIGEAIEGLAGDYIVPFLSELAHHFFQAAQSGNHVDKAIAYAIRAAERATTVLAYEEAITYYERALQLLSFKEPDDELHCELLLALGKAQNRVSDFTVAKQYFQLAAERAKTRQLPRQLAHAALGLAGTRIPLSGASPATLQLLQEALTLLPQDAYALRAQLLARLAKELTYSDAHEQREQWSYEAIRIARLTADPYALGAALCDHCIATWRPDTLSERLTLSVEITAVAEQVGDGELVFYSHFLRIANAMEQGDSLTIDAEIAGFARQMTEIRPPIYSWVWFYERLQTMRALLTGRFAEAEEQLLSSSPSLSHIPDSQDRGPMVFPQFLVLRREQGRLRDPGLEAMLKQAAEQYPALSALRCALAYVRSELGREAEARVEFENWAAHNFATVPQRQDRLVIFAYLVELCTTWGDTTRAVQLYDLLRPYAERNIVVGTALGYLDTVAHLLGKLATVLGRYEDAQDHFEFSLQRNQRMGARPRLAHTQYSYACLLLSRNQPGDQEQAATLLDQALTTADELGMGGLIEKTQSAKLKVQSTAGLEARVQRLESTNQPTFTPQPLSACVFHNEGDYWTITYQGAVLRLKNTTGLQYIEQLLRHPQHEFHVLDLVKTTSAVHVEPQTITTGLESSELSDAGDMLDPQARAAYKRRLADLRDELAEAQTFNDVARIERLQQEWEFLTQELTNAYGLGGRKRKAASAAQRARVNVTLSIKNVLKKIEKQNPTLALYFSPTIKTGIFCSYTPDPRIPLTWEF